MKLLRLFFDVILLVAGAAAGVYWGVHHPAEAANIAQQERVQGLRLQVAASKAKIEMLQKFGGDSAAAKQVLADEQKKLDDANQQLATSPAP